MTADAELQELLRGGQTMVREIRRRAIDHGMMTLMDDAIEKIRSHTTSIDEVFFALNQIDA